MPTLPDAHISGLAESCVNDMGDIFWDYEQSRDGKLDFLEPQSVAIDAAAATLHAFAQSLEANPLYTTALRLEYREMVSRAAANCGDETMIAVLVRDGEWTEKSASELLRLAQKYGTSILRNALALAEALNIEDGEAGL